MKPTSHWLKLTTKLSRLSVCRLCWTILYPSWIAGAMRRSCLTRYWVINTLQTYLLVPQLLILNFQCKWPQIIIVDDASIDKTTEIASEYSTQHRNLIRILRLGENHGKGGAIKLGIQRARGKYILMVQAFSHGTDEHILYVASRRISFVKNDNYQQVDADGATNIRDLDTLYSELQTIQRSSQDAPDESLGLVLGSRYMMAHSTSISNEITVFN